MALQRKELWSIYTPRFTDAVVFGANSYAMLRFSSKETGQRRDDVARHVVPWGSPLGLCVELCCCCLDGMQGLARSGGCVHLVCVCFLSAGRVLWGFCKKATES